jgi:hypothetical protein
LITGYGLYELLRRPVRYVAPAATAVSVCRRRPDRYVPAARRKSVSDIYAPVTGEVVARNESLDTDSALINSDPYGEGWLIEVKLAEADAVESLLSASEYEQQVG